MSSIVIVGLGPGNPEDLTRAAWTVLSTAKEIWLRTSHHPVVSGFPAGLQIHSFDALYEASRTFEEVYNAIVGQVVELGRREAGVVYGVPGHPLVAEATVPRILATARTSGIQTQVISGLSFLEPLLTALEVSRPAGQPWVDLVEGLQILDALDVMAFSHPQVNPDFPALIAQVYSRAVASELKLTLMNQYPDEHGVALVEAAGTAAESVSWLPLYEIDRRDLGPLSSLYVPGLPTVSSFAGFQETIARLRAPDGCPWDREQTHQSLRTNLLEEAYEVLDAIDHDDVAALQEELGDLLLQIVLHAQIATEYGEFRMPEVISGIDAKIKHRHPHVWGGLEVSGSEEVTLNWEAIKRQEREKNGQRERSLLDGVPRTLPALAQSYAYADRARRVRLDAPDLDAVVADVRHAVEAFAGAEGAAGGFPAAGELLFAVANWLRWRGIEPESALREANMRFARRLRDMERAARTQGMTVEDFITENGFSPAS
ncbi:MAG: nucleoside triphosphate pyrophosphohydrolase [Anaerolineae bacterium]|nr:nucleoside triphosphate pyrophosphohydrolase [Anaerolineae bacterium]